jgi:hypothetical protein
MKMQLSLWRISHFSLHTNRSYKSANVRARGDEEICTMQKEHDSARACCVICDSRSLNLRRLDHRMEK